MSSAASLAACLALTSTRPLVAKLFKAAPTPPTAAPLQKSIYSFSSMSDQQPHKDPEIFKHLSPKTQGYLRAAKHYREEQEQEQSSANMSDEQTFIAIKPDGVQRGLVGPIISRFEARGYKLTAIKLVTASKEHLEKHYEDLSSKPFFPGLVKYMGSGPICAMVWEGRDAVKTGRVLLGATNPLASAPGTIRGDYSIETGRNICHGSDSVENAKKEIALWFKEGEIQSWKSAQHDWIYEK